MKCYEITTKIVPGLPLYYSSVSNPHVLIADRGGVVTDSHGLVPLSKSLCDALSASAGNELFTISRLLSCDYERRSSLWLVPESEPSLDALILFTAHNLEANTPGELSFTTSGECSIIAQCDFARVVEKYPPAEPPVVARKGKSVLAVLRPGGSVSAIESFSSRSGFVMKKLQKMDEILSTVTMHQDTGRLVLAYQSKRTEYLARIMSGSPQARFDASD